MLRLSRLLGKASGEGAFSLPLPAGLGQGRAAKRPSLIRDDRRFFYHWNLLSVALTILPIGYLLRANYLTCPEAKKVLAKIDSPPDLHRVDRGMYIAPAPVC